MRARGTVGDEFGMAAAAGAGGGDKSLRGFLKNVALVCARYRGFSVFWGREGLQSGFFFGGWGLVIDLGGVRFSD